MPPPKMSTLEWSNRYRFVSSKASARSGKYKSSVTPYIDGILDAVDDPNIHEIVGMKSAQVAWTELVNNVIGKRADIDPLKIIIMFPTLKASKKYSIKKFRPMVEATPRLRAKIDLSGSRKSGNTWDFWNFPGGSVEFVTSRAISDLKSDAIPFIVVEEPADAATDVNAQGDSIALIRERAKTYNKWKMIIGGTPSVKGACPVEAQYERGDKRKFYVECRNCGDRHVLGFENLRWDEGKAEDAFYHAPCCDTAWNDNDKNWSVKHGEWRATAPFKGVASFWINELYSPFPGSKIALLAQKWEDAKGEAAQGKIEKLVVFVNSSMGIPYQHAGLDLDMEEMAKRADDYQEFHVPAGVLRLTAGVDVQRDRLAVTIWGFGRGMERWLIYWGELPAKERTADKKDPVWDALDSLLWDARKFKHALGYPMHVAAAGLDCSDGNFSEIGYWYVRDRKRKRHNILAIKGSSHDYGVKEIFTKPAPLDRRGKNSSKAAKMGVQVHIIGTYKAKDYLIGEHGCFHLQGAGSGRVHWYKEVRADFLEQIFSEIKIPSRRSGGKMTYEVKSGVRNEGLDCTVMSEHSAREIRLHTWDDTRWDDLEHKLKQVDLFTVAPNCVDAEGRPKKTSLAALGQHFNG